MAFTNDSSIDYFYEGRDESQYDPLTGVRLNKVIRQLSKNDKYLKDKLDNLDLQSELKIVEFHGEYISGD